MDAKMSMGKDLAVTSVIVDDDSRFIDDGYEVSLKCHGHDIYIDKHTVREIIKFLEKAFNTMENQNENHKEHPIK